MKLEERLYALHQHDNYGERYLFFKYCLRFVVSHMRSYLACNPSQMLETIMSLSQSMLLMIPDIRIYEALGHNKAVREETRPLSGTSINVYTNLFKPFSQQGHECSSESWAHCRYREEEVTALTSFELMPRTRCKHPTPILPL